VKNKVLGFTKVKLQSVMYNPFHNVVKFSFKTNVKQFENYLNCNIAIFAEDVVR
jgi:hypothetical protein